MDLTVDVSDTHIIHINQRQLTNTSARQSFYRP
ncbi:Uncharacterised protein [Vibrio cholerae]|nr:Uncharacterised protein [Vibrio cholerae]